LTAEEGDTARSILVDELCALATVASRDLARGLNTLRADLLAKAAPAAQPERLPGERA
jgi:hypothetical protein